MKYFLITDRKLYTQALPEFAKQAESAGIAFFQLREKDLPLRELLSVASRIRSVLNRTKFVVNGSLEVALACEADGLHLQKENIPVEAVRKKYRTLTIGYSAHSYQEMKDAEDHGASYVFISPVFQPVSKSSASMPLGPTTVAAWANSMKIPVFALGGISEENQNELIKAGCSNLAGISLFVEDGMFTAKRMVT